MDNHVAFEPHISWLHRHTQSTMHLI